MTVRWAILGAVIGTIVGGLITAGTLLYTSTSAAKKTPRGNFCPKLTLVSLKEGWLRQGEGSRTAKLSDKPGLFGNGKWLRSLAIACGDPGNSGRSPMEFSVRSGLRLHPRAQGLDYQKRNIA